MFKDNLVSFIYWPDATQTAAIRYLLTLDRMYSDKDISVLTIMRVSVCAHVLFSKLFFHSSGLMHSTGCFVASSKRRKHVFLCCSIINVYFILNLCIYIFIHTCTRTHKYESLRIYVRCVCVYNNRN